MSLFKNLKRTVSFVGLPQTGEFKNNFRVPAYAGLDRKACQLLAMPFVGQLSIKACAADQKYHPTKFIIGMQNKFCGNCRFFFCSQKALK